MEKASAKLTDLEYRHFLMKARDAKIGGIDAWRPQSTGEKVTVALVLNRADWLKEMEYTITEAIQRTGNWLRYLPDVERELNQED